MISCKDIIGRAVFESYSEFYLTLCMAAECLRRGTTLDMSEMVVDPSKLPTSQVQYFKYLASRGALYLGNEVNEDTPDGGSLQFNMDFITENEANLFEGGNLLDVNEFIQKFKDNTEVIFITSMGNTVMHLVAYYLMSIYLGKLPKEPLTIKVDGMNVKNTYIYINLLSIVKTLEIADKFLILNIDLSDYKQDLDYNVFCNNSFMSGKHKLWTLSEKLKFLEDEGFCEGAICILWERKGINNSNPIGKLTGAKVIRINEITPKGIYCTSFAVNKTKEEVLEDYNSIDESSRYMFADLKYSKPHQADLYFDLYELGIGEHFFEEAQFITKIDRFSKVIKKVTIDGKVSSIEMSERDAIYWLMCQYGLEFNRTLYKRMYNKGNPLLWDLHGSSEITDDIEN